MAKTKRDLTAQLRGLPDLNNIFIPTDPIASLGDAVDRLGRVLAAKARLEEYEDAAKKMLRESGLLKIDGDLYAATVTKSDRYIIDTDAVTAEMGERWVRKHSRWSPSKSVRVFPLVSS